jgi:prepilin-type N-terminal cleavage/methylation domain-containing protein
MRNATTPKSRNELDARSGVTLTEVLMSLMIMSIGISSVMVLFPISVLRSVQSTQLTNAAILKYNTAAQIRQNPQLLFDPNGNYNLQNSDVGREKALLEHFLSGNSRNYIVDPVGFHELFGVDSTGDGVVDANDDVIARSFGNDGILPGFQPAGQANRAVLRRYDGGVLAKFGGVEESSVASAGLTPDQIASMSLLASRLARLRDGRTNQLDTTALSGLIANINGTNRLIGIQLPDTVLSDDLIAIPTAATTRPGNLIPDPEIAEVTLFSANGKFSQTFPLTHIDVAARKVFWSEYDDAGNSTDFNDNGTLDVRELPLEFQGQVGQVILRSVRSADFSWLLTVRRSGDGQARGIDVVIRYHTGVQPMDERIFPATFVSGAGFIGVNDAADGAEPVLKRGAYVFDPVNARWYRITNHEVRPSAGLIPSSETAFWTAYKYRVTLESAIISDAGAFPTGSSAAVYSGAIFLPGVVDVYPMGSMSLPASL